MNLTLAGAVIFGALALLTGCGSEQDAPRNDVASLATPAATGGASTSAPPPVDESKRPQLRLDSTDEEIAAAWKDYDACLKQNNHVMLSERKHAGPLGDGTQLVDMNDDSPRSVAARQKCKGSLPMPPPEKDRAKNPDYLDDHREMIKCINDHGIAVKDTDPPGEGYNYIGSGSNPENSGQIEKACEIEAFSK